MKKLSRQLNSKLVGVKRRLFKKPQVKTPQLPTFIVHFDSPKEKWIKDKTLTISGWLLPESSAAVKAMRVKNNDQYFSITYGLKRHDVPKAYPDYDTYKALRTGFLKKLKYYDGPLEIEVDLGLGWQTVRSLDIQYSPEDLVDMLYNPDLSMNLAEHTNLLEGKRKYYFEQANQNEYQRQNDDSRLVTFYLPQYHPIKENDEHWGKGFTEWTNVVNAKPRFVGHQQPLLPTDLGFYDLRLAENIASQIQLAKQHGIYGFCFYYYWFSRERLLEKPLDIFLEHKEWDFNFMIAWANENWTKRWDGMDEDVIIAQKYLESDPLSFIKDVEHILLDSRYIRENGKPVLVVYRGSKLGDPALYIKTWREYFQEKHNLDLHILSVLGLDVSDPRPFGFDAGIEFEPLTIAKRTDFNKQKPAPINVFHKLLDKDFQGGVADYRQVALNSTRSPFSFPTYKSVMPSWDNDARKKGKGPTIFYGANPDIYGQWLDNTINHQKKRAKGSPLIFINAWNEWAEGAVLEPTMHNGHAFLNRTVEVLSKHSKLDVNRVNFPMYGIRRNYSSLLAVVIHVFYKEEWLYIRTRLKTLDSINYDLFITITEKNKDLVAEIHERFPRAFISIVPNRGRDILPFLFLLPRLKNAGYTYILKLHTKRSTHRNDGKEWFNDLVDKLLPSSKRNKEILYTLEQGVGIVGPSGHYISLEKYIGSNLDHLSRVLYDRFDDKKTNQIIDNINTYGYFAGSMFWARIDSLDCFTTMPFIPEDFESERGQIDGTLAHAVERLITIIPIINNEAVYESSDKGVNKVSTISMEYEYAK
jgi:lipopolysaccharide biosynthesis protein